MVFWRLFAWLSSFWSGQPQVLAIENAAQKISVPKEEPPKSLPELKDPQTDKKDVLEAVEKPKENPVKVVPEEKPQIEKEDAPEAVEKPKEDLVKEVPEVKPEATREDPVDPKPYEACREFEQTVQQRIYDVEPVIVISPLSPEPKLEDPAEKSQKLSESEDKPSFKGLDQDTVCFGMEDISYRFQPSPASDGVGSTKETKQFKKVTDEMIKQMWIKNEKLGAQEDIPLTRINKKMPKFIYKKLRFTRKTDFYTMTLFKQGEHKRVVRLRPDAWRRYGCLKKLYEIGGWTFELNGHGHHHASVATPTPLKQYTKVAPHTAPPSAPTLPPIMTEEELLKRPLLIPPTSSGGSRPRRTESKLGSAEHNKKEKPILEKLSSPSPRSPHRKSGKKKSCGSLK
ncbi:hypothetical protein L596_009066 [Steinernema carpocapsae]|uniref:Uncharacterized protein n=1 Tax=Steinernema carpocapsae TaxID=34508 RepID=A0A4U5PF44_STECR|nr:hypothetical protein L596_009066 [Steinernema carpocapsae]